MRLRPYVLALLLAGTFAPALPQSGTFTINVRETPLRDVIQMIARAGRFNVVMAPEVKGRTSVELNGVPALRALALVARMHGFTVGRRDSVYLVGPRDTVLSMVQNQVVAVFPVMSRNAEDVVEQVRRHFPDLVVTVDRHTNSVVVSRQPPAPRPPVAVEDWPRPRP